jgi:hypothetical protein
VLALVVSAIVCALAMLLAMRGFHGTERRLAVYAFAAHVAASLALVAYTQQSGGDMLGYAYFGRQLAAMMRADFFRHTPEIIKLALHLDNNVPAVVGLEMPTAEILQTSPTVTMFCLSGLAMFVVDDSLNGAALVFAMFSFLGLVHLYKNTRGAFEAEERVPMMISLLFVPSLMFWCGGIIKEAVVVGGIGFLAGSAHQVIAHRRFSMLPVAIFGAVAIGVVKPYVLFPIVLAGAAWFFAQRKRRWSLAARLGALVVAGGGLAVLSKLFPEFGLARLGESVAAAQQTGATLHLGGSFVEVGDGAQRSILGQMQYVPIALTNALARPFIFEVRNASMLVAALETTTIVVIGVALIRRYGIGVVYRRVRDRAPLFASAMFVLSFGTAVGLATANLGTLSRYRVPMMPMYIGIVLCVRASLRAKNGVGAVPKKGRRPVPPWVAAARRARQSRAGSLMGGTRT